MNPKTSRRGLSAKGALAAQAVAIGAVVGLAALAGPATGSVEYASKLLRTPVVIGNDDHPPIGRTDQDPDTFGNRTRTVIVRWTPGVVVAPTRRALIFA
jgi:hypothetical protein